MADVKAVDERAELPEKRKLDLAIPVEKSPDENKDESDSKKRQKFQVPSEKNGSVSPTAGENALAPNEHLSTRAAAEEGDEENDDEEEDDYTAEEDEDRDEEPEIVDRKGKGIMIDHKGKGKMIEDSEDDDDDDGDDDDSSDDSGSGFSDGLDESDLEDDPLAEVDLDNILPSRTRRRLAQPGFRIFGNSDKGKDV